MYIDVVSTLSAIQEQKTTKGNVRTKARGYKEGLLRYEWFTAQLFLRILYLNLHLHCQTGGMDNLSAHRMVITTQEALKQISREVQVVKDVTILSNLFQCFFYELNQIHEGGCFKSYESLF